MPADIEATIAESRRLREQARRARSGLGPVVDRLAAERAAVQRSRNAVLDLSGRRLLDVEAANQSAVAGRHAASD